MMFLGCPAYLDDEGARRCGLPAEVRCRFTMGSADGPLEAAMIRCPAGHWFNGPIEFLTWEGKPEHEPGHAAASSVSHRFRDDPDDVGPRRLAANSPKATARAGNVPRYTRLDRGARSAVRHLPEQRQQGAFRPNTAPFYYMGRPAGLWITAMTPHRRRKPLAVAQTQTSGEDQPSNPADNTQPEPSQVMPQILPALR